MDPSFRRNFAFSVVLSILEIRISDLHPAIRVKTDVSEIIKAELNTISESST